MLIRSTMTAGFQCHSCGNIQCCELSYFKFGAAGEHAIICESCGRTAATLQRKKKGKLLLKVGCIDCYDEHSYSLCPVSLWGAPLKAFRCSETDEIIFLAGDTELVRNAMKAAFYTVGDGENNKRSRETPEDLGAFDTPLDVMKLIEHFQHMAAEGKIFCSCGEYYLEMKIERDVIRFACPGCGNEMLLDISTKEKIEQVKRLGEICLT